MPRPVSFVFCLGLAAALVLSCPSAMAHHNAHWSRTEHISLSGTIVSVYVGYPHSHVEVDCAGEMWSLDIGQPWHIEEIHLPVTTLVPGARIRVFGNPTEQGGDHRLKVLRMELGTVSYVF